MLESMDKQLSKGNRENYEGKMRLNKKKLLKGTKQKFWSYEVL